MCENSSVNGKWTESQSQQKWTKEFESAFKIWVSVFHTVHFLRFQLFSSDLSETASLLRKSMDRSETDLEKVSADHQQAVENLKSLTDEAQNLQEISSDKEQQVLNIKHSDPRGEQNTQTYRFKYMTHMVLSEVCADHLL